MPLSSLKETYNRAKSWLSARFSNSAQKNFTEIDFSWIDDRIGYPGIAHSVFGSGSVRHDYTFHYVDVEQGGNVPIFMRYDIMRSENHANLAIYSGYADAHTGTVLLLQKVGRERYRITDFYTCENGRHVENLPLTEEDVGDFIGETTYVLNLVGQNGRTQRLRDSLSVVRGGRSP